MSEEWTKKLADEKERRIYYQDVVYRVCNLIDRAAGRNARIGTGVVAGTIDNPSQDIDRTLSGLFKELSDLRRQDDVQEKSLAEAYEKCARADALARAAERDQCARIAEFFHKGQSEPYDGDRRERGAAIAASIRRRGQFGPGYSHEG